MNNNTVIFNHPLISHKIALLRDVNTGTRQFRELVEEVAMLMAYEALKDIETVDKEITTPIDTVVQKIVKEHSVAVIPILRAGLGMVNGVQSLLPTAKVGHIGLYRDPQTLKPADYYCKLPEGIKNMTAVLLDPMLATGGSASAAIRYLKDAGCKKIKLMSIIAAPEGIDRVEKDHPDIQLYIACKDEKLNPEGYIVPGLGDAGDRLFGTK